MERRISATDLARTFGDVLGRVRYRRDSFVIEREGDAVARLVPLPGEAGGSVREAIAAWHSGGEPDPEFAEVLEKVRGADSLRG